MSSQTANLGGRPLFLIISTENSPKLQDSFEDRLCERLAQGYELFQYSCKPISERGCTSTYRVHREAVLLLRPQSEETPLEETVFVGWEPGDPIPLDTACTHHWVYGTLEGGRRVCICEICGERATVDSELPVYVDIPRYYTLLKHFKEPDNG